MKNLFHNFCQLSINPGLARNQAGFTLVEISLYLALFSILVVALSDIFLTILDLQTFSQTQSSVAADAQFTTARLQYDLSQADQVLTPANPGDTSSELVYTLDGETYTYRVVSSILEVSGPETATAVSDLNTLVSDLSFKRLGSPSGTNSIKASYQLLSLTDSNRNRLKATESVEVTIRIPE